LDEANVATTETFVAVTNNDEVNILASLQAKRLGATRVITLINNVNYIDLVNALGIDTLVNPRAITVSTILQHVRRGRIRAVHALREGIGEIVEAELLDTSDLGGIPIREAPLPEGVIFGAILRGDQIIIPDGDTVMRSKDRVVLFAMPEAVREVEDLFTVRLEYF
jgi:trk system potassium uptake protein TrkA